MASGYHCTTERKYPTKCGVNFSMWIPREGLINRILNNFYTSDLNKVRIKSLINKLDEVL
jgi:hypothetical protein